MKKILFAIGHKSIEDALVKELQEGFTSAGTATYKEVVIKNIMDLRPNIIILRENLPGNGKILDIVYQIRIHYPNIRVIFIAEKKYAGDTFLQSLVSYGVYDIISGDKIHLSAILDCINVPKSLKDVEQFQPVRADVTTEAVAPLEQHTQFTTTVPIEKKKSMLASMKEKNEVRKAEKEKEKLREDARLLALKEEAALKAIADKEAKIIADKEAEEKRVIAERILKEKQEQEAIENAKKEELRNKLEADKKAIEDKVLADKALADKVIADKVIADKIISDKAAADKASAEKLQIAKIAEARAIEDKALKEKQDREEREKTAREAREKEAREGREIREKGRIEDQRKREEYEKKVIADRETRERLEKENAEKKAIEEKEAQEKRLKEEASRKANTERENKERIEKEDIAKKAISDEAIKAIARQEEHAKKSLEETTKAMAVHEENNKKSITEETSKAAEAIKNEILEELKQNIKTEIEANIKAVEVTKPPIVLGGAIPVAIIKPEVNIGEKAEKMPETENNEVTSAQEPEKTNEKNRETPKKESTFFKKIFGEREEKSEKSEKEELFFEMNSGKHQVVAFLGSKHGVGNTTVALNVAGVLAMTKKVLFIEVNDKFPMTNYLLEIININNGLEKAVIYAKDGNINKIKQTIMQPSIPQIPRNLHFLSFSNGFLIQDRSQRGDDFKAEDIKALIYCLMMEGLYDYLIIDVQPDDNEISEALTESRIIVDKLFITLTQDAHSMGCVGYKQDKIRRFNEDLSNRTFYVLNKYDDKCSVKKKNVAKMIDVNIDYLSCLTLNYTELINTTFEGHLYSSARGKAAEFQEIIQNIVNGPVTK